MDRSHIVLAPTALACGLILAGCQREARPFRPNPPSAEAVQWIRLTPLQAGTTEAADLRAAMVEPIGHIENEYEENAYALAEGKRLYSAFNCNGCHAHGGGNSGPPLMDDTWIYGHHPEQVFSTIVEGRPNGMPSFGGRIPAYQIWQLAAYVRSMSGLVRKDAAPARNDDMKTKPPENSMDPEEPVQVPPP